MKLSFKFKFFVFVVLCCVQFKYIVTDKQFYYEPCCKDYLDIRCSNGKLALIACKQNCLPNGRTPKYWMGRYCEYGTRGGVLYYGCECLIKGIKKQIIWESDYVENEKGINQTPYQPSHPKPIPGYAVTPSTTETPHQQNSEHFEKPPTQAKRRSNTNQGQTRNLNVESDTANPPNSPMNESPDQELKISKSSSVAWLSFFIVILIVTNVVLIGYNYKLIVKALSKNPAIQNSTSTQNKRVQTFVKPQIPTSAPPHHQIPIKPSAHQSAVNKRSNPELFENCDSIYGTLPLKV